MPEIENNRLISGKDICVVIPTEGKREEALTRALTSVFEQSEACGEIVIVWDSPSLPPADILRHKHLRVIPNSSGSKGVAGARNSGILSTNLPFIALLDDDDWWLPQKISEYVKAINDSPRTGFYVSRARYLTDSGDNLGVFPTKRFKLGVSLSSYLNNNIFMLRRRITIPTSSYVFPREIAGNINLFNQEIFLAEDQLLLLKLNLFLPFYLVGNGPLSVTTIYRDSKEGLSKRYIAFVNWIETYNTYFSFLGNRQRDNAILFYGMRHHRLDHSLKETLLWSLTRIKTKADLVTILSSFTWLITNEILRISKKFRKNL